MTRRERNFTSFLVPTTTEQLKPRTPRPASLQTLKAVAFRARLPRWIACPQGSSLAASLWNKQRFRRWSLAGLRTINKAPRAAGFQLKGSLNLRGRFLLLLALGFLAQCQSLSQSCSHSLLPTETTQVLKLKHKATRNQATRTRCIVARHGAFAAFSGCLLRPSC